MTVVLVPNSWGSMLSERNPCHEPAGSPTGGQFCSTEGAWAQTSQRMTAKRRAKKTAMRPATDAERKKAGVPPAYTDVEVPVDPKQSEVLWRARDAKGRSKSQRRKDYTQAQAAAKWSRICALHRAMPGLRAKIDKALAGKGREYQQAMTLHLILLTGMRNGGEGESSVYEIVDGKRVVVEDVDTYGATSLRMEHVALDGNTVTVDFVGKSGVHQRHSVEDARLAMYVRGRQFKRAETLFDHESGETLDYLKSISGGRFVVKDLRSWHATVLADRLVQTLVRDRVLPKTQKEFKAVRKEVATRVSEVLGNSPAMALNNYIHPAALAPLAQGVEKREKRR